MEFFVSIVINNYNYANYVGNAITSALAQTYHRKEVIVVDDGSTDNSRQIIAEFGDLITPVLKENGGQASAFNEGFAASRGDVICFLDSDDVFLPGKVERVIDAMESCPEGWCFHQLQWADSTLNAISTPPIPYSTGKYDFRKDIRDGRCQFLPPATSGLTFSRHLLQQLMPMPNEIKITSDNYLKLSSMAIAPGHFIAEPLALQRMHGNNAFTGKKDALLRADVQLATAVGLRANFPSLRRLCNRMFAAGLVEKWGSGSNFKVISQEMRAYLADLPLSEKTETLSRIAYRALCSGFSPNEATD
jgi:glycosyltransferase involved in cell wall biosynthesis